MTRYTFRFERRRYGTTTFTWAWVEHRGELISLGDPWPGCHPKRAALEAAAARAIAQVRETEPPRHLSATD